MSYILDFPIGYGTPEISGEIRQTNADFIVNELLPEGFLQAGEHVVVQIEKSGQNTAYLARRLANFAGVREMDVGYCGLKDRHALTTQWFSVYFGSRPQPDWEKWRLEETRILNVASHSKKLRRGDHQCNAFEITIRQLQKENGQSISDSDLQQRMTAIAESGVPNYFGEQRFGKECHNLQVADAWFSGAKRMKVKAGAMYISAARAYLFNQVLAERVKQGDWAQAINGDLLDDKGQTLGSLFGDGEHKQTGAALDTMAAVEARWPLLVEGLRRNRIAVAQRPMVLKPEGLHWQLEKDTLCVKFKLPVGAFATSVLREIINYRDVSGSR